MKQIMLAFVLLGCFATAVMAEEVKPNASDNLNAQKDAKQNPVSKLIQDKYYKPEQEERFTNIGKNLAKDIQDSLKSTKIDASEDVVGNTFTNLGKNMAIQVQNAMGKKKPPDKPSQSK